MGERVAVIEAVRLFHAAELKALRPIGTAEFVGAGGGGLPVVGDAMEGGGPAFGELFDDRVAGVGREGFHNVGDGRVVVISGQADAAGVEDERAIFKLYEARNVGVAAQDQGNVDCVAQVVCNFLFGTNVGFSI